MIIKHACFINKREKKCEYIKMKYEGIYGTVQSNDES